VLYARARYVYVKHYENWRIVFIYNNIDKKNFIIRLNRWLFYLRLYQFFILFLYHRVSYLNEKSEIEILQNNTETSKLLVLKRLKWYRNAIIMTAKLLFWPICGIDDLQKLFTLVKVAYAMLVMIILLLMMWADARATDPIPCGLNIITNCDEWTLKWLYAHSFIRSLSNEISCL